MTNVHSSLSFLLGFSCKNQRNVNLILTVFHSIVITFFLVGIPPHLSSTIHDRGPIIINVFKLQFQEKRQNFDYGTTGSGELKI